MDTRPHTPGGADHIPSIPKHSSASPTALRCCCGRDDCALLEHNNVALEGLEKDLETAARLGQALLYRHESYMAEAEEDRQRLVASIDALEREKRQVQAENARIVEENRSLLDQLDGLNQAASESDDRAKMLALTLESTQAELRKLTVAAARAAELETQLIMMETEQSRLQDILLSTQDDEKSALQRWKNAESTLRDLHDQVDRIEKEAREERERHEDLVQRMERKRAVERELDNAAGRLKGAAAASDLNRNPDGTVVSRFVKDILQDNANLQVGIIELREMLESSNQEVQNLREQVMSHQPLAGDGEDDNAIPASSTTLSEELEAKERRRVSQEFHIHHHYHSPSAKKDKSSLNRRVKKKRSVMGSSSSGTQSPRRPGHRAQLSNSSTSTILSQTSVSIPPPTSSRRLSLQSRAADSIASSPQSAFHTSSIFDRVDRGFDSQPTSPGSTVFGSPIMGARNVKGFDLPFQPLAEIDSIDASLDDPSQAFDDEHFSRADGKQPVIPEESEEASSAPYQHAIPVTDEGVFDMQMPFTPLRRSTSHDSLFDTVAGMDIHTPTSRFSRMGDWRAGMRIPQRMVSPSVELVSTPPVVSAPIITVDRGKSSEKTSRSLLASVAAGNNVPTESSSIISAESAGTSSTATPRKSATLGRRMGGWVLGRWGMAAVASDGETRPESSPSLSSSTPSAGFHNPVDPAPPRFRFTGVNQKVRSWATDLHHELR
ncbi:hypothetical protein N7474_010489 [Penicillium riverlandense]|uniref:uncharacterized protein n=1 Tax=Penicillium riverlandense TaxID=1903569 RepID=UPI0025489AF7|nr:uncharacterized protein N7474_010489 [Penicillium riverlandense]KAJ5806897.1 hypothetical protein N7474_010489 [Penicillium riverlandense]